MAEAFVDLCGHGDLDGVQAALRSGADVNSRNEKGETPLIKAVSWRRTAVALHLLEQDGIDINCTDNSG